MNNLTKVSDITSADAAEYLRLPDPTAADLVEVGNYLRLAIDYVQNFTGLNPTEMDYHPDLIAAVLVQMQDFYDNRTMYVDGKSPNKAVESILGMHSVNLLPTE